MTSEEKDEVLKRKLRRDRDKSKNISRDEEGVAEVVGNILTLAITVIIFASVFAGVTQIDPPEEETHVELQAEYEFAGEHTINMKHEGGESLDMREHSIILTFEYPDDDGEYMTIDDIDRTWRIGEELILDEDDGLGDMDELLREETVLELMIRDDDTHQIIYRKILVEEGSEIFEIRNAHMDYAYHWRNHAERGEEVTIKAEVAIPVYLRQEEFSYEDNITVTARPRLIDDVIEEASRDESVNLTHDRANEFSKSLNVTSDAEYGSHSIQITAEHDELGEVTDRFISLNVGETAYTEHSDELSIGEIEVEPEYPSHNEEFTVEFEVFNLDRRDHIADWNLTDNGELIDYEEGVKFEESPAPTRIEVEYDIRGVGEHDIKIEVTPEEAYEDIKRETVFVGPSVLVVEDITARDTDDLTLMRDALTDVNYDHSVYTVGDEDDFPEDVEEYSTTIWLTGESWDEDDDDPPIIYDEDAQSTITEKVREDDIGLWLIGENLDQVDFEQEFANLLGLSSVDEGEVIEDTLIPIEEDDGTFGDLSYPIEGQVDNIEEDEIEDKNILEAEDNNFIAGIGNYEEDDEDDEHRSNMTAVTTFLFESISDPELTVSNSAARGNLTNEVTMWLNDLDERVGTDVSVSSQVIEPTSPMFGEDLTVTTTIRNNAPEDLYEVPVALVKNGEIFDETNVDIPAGGTNTTSFTWEEIDELGTHQLVVEVDAYEEMDLVTRDNNDIRYKDLDDLDLVEDEIEVDVHYSSLIVDDEGYPDDEGDPEKGEISEEVLRSFERLGQEIEIEGEEEEAFDYHNVEEDGPPSDARMRRYNAIIWITGSQEEPIEPEEANYTLEYFDDGHGNILFIGEHILSDLHWNAYEADDPDVEPDDAEDLLRYMGVEPKENNIGSTETSYLKGEEDSHVGKTLRYDLGQQVELDNFTEVHESDLFELEDVELEEGPVDDELIDEFDENDIDLDEQAMLFEEGDNWIIREYGKRMYRIEDGQEVHGLFGEVLFSAEDYNYGSVYDDGTLRNVYMPANIDDLESPYYETGEEFVDDWPAGPVDTSRENMREEFVYTMLWYFGMRDDRTELRVTDYDIEGVVEENLETGRSYEIVVDVENYGYDDTDTLVRFKEGDELIGSRNINIEGSEREAPDGATYFEVDPGSTTVEMTWEPMYGGERPVRIKVDPLGLEDEIAWDEEEEESVESNEGKLMEFNNQAVVTEPVYFFFDDMESGDEKWDHDTTLMNMDRYSPLEGNVLGPGEANTEVKDSWCDDLSENLNETDEEYRSPPGSYFIEEDGEVEEDILLGIMIDNSNSMKDRYHEGESWVSHAADAALSLVENLTEDSMVSLWSYRGENAESWMDDDEPIQVGGNEQELEDKIIDIRDQQAPQTISWDAIGGAYEEISEAIPDNPDLEPAVIGFTDAGDKRAAEPDDDYGRWEQGSEEWAPWHDMGEEKEYDSHYGKYRFDYEEWIGADPTDPGEWKEVGTQAQGPGEREGLLNAPIPIFTAGLAIEHFDKPENTENPIEDPDWNPAESLQDADEDNFLIERTEGNKATYEAGTVEYNLWRIADTSDAEYFYAPDPGELDVIFDEILDLITDPGDLRSIDDPITPDLDPDEQQASLSSSSRAGEYEARAVTQPMDLQDANSAEFSFWHRYDLLEGVNGGYLMIGFENDDGGEYDWHYVEPSDGSYTGNLLMQDEMPEDDFDNSVQWVWNRKSADGTLDWEHARLDIIDEAEDIIEEEDLDESHLDNIRAGLFYTHYGFPDEAGGWWIDNVRVTASYDWSEDGPGYWDLTNAEGLEEKGIIEDADNNENYHDHTLGNEEGHYWIYTAPEKDEDGNVVGDKLPRGVDSSLYTQPIYLDNADNPQLTAHMQFNIDDGEGRPPNGFRVEISDDDGETWDSLTYGARSAWGYSGEDGEDCEYSGVTEDGDEEDYGWVDSNTLARLEADLTGWRGQRVLLRFRVFTNTTEDDDAFYSDPDLPRAVFIDDVWVTEGDMEIKNTGNDASGMTDNTDIKTHDDLAEDTVNFEEEEKEEDGSPNFENNSDSNDVLLDRYPHLRGAPPDHLLQKIEKYAVIH